jgi:hypothetical protein
MKFKFMQMADVTSHTWRKQLETYYYESSSICTAKEVFLFLENFFGNVCFVLAVKQNEIM